MMGGIVTQDDLPRMHITKVDGALIVVPADHYLVERGALTETQILNRAKACIQCGFCTEQCPRYLIGHDLHPHKMMNVIKYGQPMDESCAEAQLCCACGVCEMFSCPMGIDPRQVNLYIANKLREQGIRYKHDGGEIIAREGREQRKTPPQKLIERLDLTRWDHQHLHEHIVVDDVDTVTLAMSQHVGVNSLPQVCVGDRVEKGQIIGAIPEEKLGSNIHASISGFVTAVDNDKISISKKNINRNAS